MSYPEIGEVVVVDKPYHIMSKIGSGGYASVFSAKDSNGVEYAIKIIKTENSGALCLEEASFTSAYTHRHINSALAIELTRDFLYIVQERAAGGDLYAWVKRTKPTIATATMVAHQLGLALAFLHRENIIHGDVKPSNVLVCLEGDSPVVKLSDFGLAVRRHWCKTQYVCTDSFKPPEVWANAEWDEKLDVWCYGATIYHTIFHHDLFVDQNESTHRYRDALVYWERCHNARSVVSAGTGVNTINTSSSFASPRIENDVFGRGLHSVVYQCLTPLASKRPTIEAVLAKSVFRTMSAQHSAPHLRRLTSMASDVLRMPLKLYPLPPDVVIDAPDSTSIDLITPTSLASEPLVPTTVPLQKRSIIQAEMAYDIHRRYKKLTGDISSEAVIASLLIAQKITKDTNYKLPMNNRDDVLRAERDICRQLGFLLC